MSTKNSYFYFCFETWSFGQRTEKGSEYSNFMRPISLLGSVTTISRLPMRSHSSASDYTGVLVLENGMRSRLLFDGGYVSVSNSAYHFFLTDHLGSVRVVANASGTAEEYDHYYPLGGPIAKYSTATSIQPVKYQGEEWGASKGLDLYDFGARRYDPATGRWLSQDPLAEKYYSISPYTFCHNNPIIRFDPNGLVDWKLFRSGLYTTIGGVMSTVGGSALAGATGGVAAGLSAFIISDGILAIGTGMALMTAGLTDDSQLSEDIQDIPTNIPEMGGEMLDNLTGNKKHLYKKIGSGVDVAIGLEGSFYSGFTPLIPSFLGIAAPVAAVIDDVVSERNNEENDRPEVEGMDAANKQPYIWAPNQQMLTFLQKKRVSCTFYL